MNKATDERVIKALHDGWGVVATAAQILTKQGFKYSRSGLLRRIQRSEKLEQARVEAEGNAVDVAEWQLFKHIQSGNLNAIQFFLRSRCDKYRPVVEISGGDEKKFPTAAELEAQLKEMGFVKQA